MLPGEARDAILNRFSAYRAETQMLAEYALVLAVVTVLTVAAYTWLRPMLVGTLQDVARNL